jgi:hypothetical protein
MVFKSYAAGAGVTSDPSYKSPYVGVDPEWVFRFGSRAQRRRLEREIYRQPKPAKKPKAKKRG